MQRELVVRAMGGDHEAFTRLVDASVSRLYAAANMVLRDHEQAQDAVQEALVAAWRDLRSLRDPDAWEAWTYRLTVWACYRQARKDRRRSLTETRVALASTDQTGDIATPVIERDRIERQLGRLPIEQRAVIVVHFYLGRPIAEAAAILDIPVGTAKARLYRGLQALRDAMSAEPDAQLRPAGVSA